MSGSETDRWAWLLVLSFVFGCNVLRILLPSLSSFVSSCRGRGERPSAGPCAVHAASSLPPGCSELLTDREVATSSAYCAQEAGRSQATLPSRGAAWARHPHRCLAPERLSPATGSPPSALSVGTRNTTEQSKQSISFLLTQVSVYVCGCFSCVYICAPWLSSLAESRRERRILWNWSYRHYVTYHVGAGYRT